MAKETREKGFETAYRHFSVSESEDMESQKTWDHISTLNVDVRCPA
jgi:hypothetical protein